MSTAGRNRWTLLLLVLLMMAPACSSSGAVAGDEPALVPTVTDAEVAEHIEHIAASASGQPREMLADGVATRDEVEVATAAARLCVDELVPELEATLGLVLQTRPPEWSSDNLYFDLPYRIGFPQGTTEPDFDLIAAGDKVVAECLEIHSDPVSQVYRLNRVPTGADRARQTDDLLECLGGAVSQQGPTADQLSCLSEHSILFEVVGD